MTYEELTDLVIKFGTAERTLGIALGKSPFDQETYSKQKAEALAIFENISCALYEFTKLYARLERGELDLPEIEEVEVLHEHPTQSADSISQAETD